MKLSISNIAWPADHDADMYAFLKHKGFSGLEIAPTRIFADKPYEHLAEARDWAVQLKEVYGLAISSMQSIWYGRQEKVFGDKEERKALIEYTRKACEFAKTIGCHNLVFGNPRNRETLDVAKDYPVAIDFFHDIGEIALEHDTIIAIEPNPTIYNTHFINYTKQAVELVNNANSKGLKVNYDLGTVIENKEDISYIHDIAGVVNHIHISEPYLAPIDVAHHSQHKVLVAFAKKHENTYLSIEMGNKGDVEKVKQIVEYLKGITDEI